MKTIQSLLLALSTLPTALVQAEAEPLWHLGRLDSTFWRTAPMPDLGHYEAAPVIWPGMPTHMGFLAETDFPYPFEKYGDSPDKPYLLHTDHMILVRFLGGWDKPLKDAEPHDLAYRDAEGAIHLRKDLLAKRLAKYVESKVVDAYTIVLDNVPYAFPEKAARGPFGQVEPPADLGEWRAFIVEVCEELEAILGPEAANTLRFRLGTEMQGHADRIGHNRFNGTRDQFFEFYEVTALAVKSVLPGAKFGPFNLAAIDQGPESHIIDFRELAVFALKRGLPFDFVGHSLYRVPLFGEHSPLKGVVDSDWNRLTNIDLSEKVAYYTDFWDDLVRIDKRFEELELQELGRLDNELALNSTQFDTGLDPRDVAGLTQTLFLLKKHGLDRLAHWGLSNPIPGTNRHILNSMGWMLQVLEHADGGDTWMLPVANRSKRSIARSQALGFFDCMSGKSYLLVSVFNPYRYIHAREAIEVSIPKRLFDFEDANMRITQLDHSLSPQRAMRDDLAAAGLLTENYLLHPDFAPISNRGVVPTGVTDLHAAEHLILENADRYLNMVKESLSLEAFEGEISSLDGNWIIPLETRASSIIVIEISKE